ncbi:MAG: alcohol dehydrogenase catalytic domain-containing protein [Bacteroidales bacterium]|nr:alcohol dehydrogenase catalytic domain-containing protein [Bacteroidales bacterium]
MLSFVYNKKEQKLILEDRPKPKPAPDDAILKVSVSAICGTDIRTYRHGSSRIKQGRIVGHEVTGILEEVGENIHGFTPGERVIVTPAIGCGDCYSCRRGYTNLCDNLETIGFDYDGGFAEFVALPAKAFHMGNINRIADSVSDNEAVLCEPVACVVNGQEPLGITEGETVAIFGAGFIGCMHAELAFLSGAERVIMIELSRPRLDVAQTHVPDIQAVHLESEDLQEKLQDLTSGRGADVVITACSAGKAQADALDVAAKRGRISLFGGLPGDPKGFLDSNVIHYKELGVFGVHASTVEQNIRVSSWLADGILKPGKYLGKPFQLSNIEKAFQALLEEEIMKAIVIPN